VQWFGGSPGLGGRPGAGDNSLMWGGALCEVLLYASALSDEDRLAITDYVVQKWGIA